MMKNERRKRKFSYEFNEIIHTSKDVDSLNKFKDYFSNEEEVAKRITAITSQEDIDEIVATTKDNIERKEEARAKKEKLNFVTKSYFPNSKRLNYLIRLESEEDFVFSSVVERIIKHLITLRKPLYYRKRCDACQKGYIHSYSQSGHFYCEDCSSYFHQNGKQQKPPYLGISFKELNIELKLNEWNEDTLTKPISKINLMKIKDDLHECSLLVDSSPPKEKQFVYGLLQMALEFLEINEKKNSKFFSGAEGVMKTANVFL